MIHRVTKSWWNAEYKEPTTKNDLGVDTDKLISDCKKMSFDIEIFNKPLKVVALDAVKNIVKDLHPVTPQEPRWIPISEKLPKKGVQVLCCNKHGSVFTSCITYRVSGSGIPHFGQHYDVIAWMPLPKPYKKQDNKIGWSSLENVREKVERGNEE